MAKSSRQTLRHTLAQGAQSDFDDLFGARQGERIVSAGFKMLAHERITVRPQVRRTFPQEEMDELRASIRALRKENGGIEGTGLLQALLVAPENGRYHLIAGEKRFRATQAEGLPEVPCVIVPAVSEGMTRLLQLTENALRSAPPVLEEAQAMRETMEQQQLSQRDLARLLGKNRGYIENRVRLLKMEPELQDMVTRRPDTLKHAQLIAGVEDAPLRRELIRAVVEEEASVKELERRLRPASTPASTNFTQPQDPVNTVELPSRDGTAPEPEQGQKPGGQGSRGQTKPIALPSRDGRAAAEHPSPEPHPAPDRRTASLLPATLFLEETQRQLTGLSLSSEHKSELRAQVETIEKHLSEIKEILQ